MFKYEARRKAQILLFDSHLFLTEGCLEYLLANKGMKIIHA